MEEKQKNNNPFPVMEEEVLDFWNKSKIFDKSLSKAAPQGDYVFYDGPPFATGEPHYGHLAGSIMKDAIPRYWTMKGWRVERKWGWDCHGLPIENIAEKELGIAHKKDIEAMGVDKFNEFCRSKVLSYVDIWRQIVPRLGRWVDMDNAYRTMDLGFMESVWWVFKQLWDKGLVYESYRSMHICPRCETTLSQSEVAEGYKDVKDLSVIAKFKLEPGQTIGDYTTDDNTYVLAWTTTPWTLIGNVALAVGEKINYYMLEVEANDAPNLDLKKGDKIILTEGTEAQIRILGGTLSYGPHPHEDDLTWANVNYKGNGNLLFKNIIPFTGSDLKNIKYKPLFDYYAKDESLENRENGWKIYAGDFVTTEDGTGVVHIASAFGEDDMNLGRQYNLPFIQHVGMDGVIMNEAAGFAGLHVKPKDDVQATDVEIIKYLAKNNTLFSKEKYEHSYPHCWRCDTPLLNYATSSYFVNVTKIKENALSYAKNINWSPDYIKEGRFGNWLEGARDWSISRQRYWASVMPIWKCECGETKVIGSVAELKELSGEEVTDLHKHIVDKIIFPCAKCGGMMKRIPDVLDTWFDSGSMPYAQMHYPFENKEKFENNFPAQFIAEGVDQTRCWFYYLHIIASAVKNSEAYKNVIVNGIVLAEDGKKMAKRLKNYPDVSFIFEQYGADAMRYYLLSSPVMLAENLNFTAKGVNDVLRNVIMTLWNVYNFYAMYATAPDVESLQSESENVLDKWILARLNQLTTEVTENMDNYNLPKASRPIAEFVNDLSTWYLRRSRDRFKGDDAQDKEQALATTRYVLLELSKLMAPFMPFMAEQIWQKVTGNDFTDENKSVHLENWPVLDDRRQTTDDSVIQEMEMVRKIVEMGLAERDKAGIKVRQPLLQLKIKNYELRIEYSELLKDELNVKAVVAEKGDGNLEVEIDTNITDDLKLEGLKRDIVRQVNALRKNAGLTINDRIVLSWQSDSRMIKDVFTRFGSDIKKETLADSVTEGVLSGSEPEKISLNNEVVSLLIAKK